MRRSNLSYYNGYECNIVHLVILYLKKKTFKPKAYAALLYPLALLFPPIFNLGNSGCLSLSKI